MALVARDLMESHVVSVSPDDPLASVQRLFVEEEIHGAPAVDETGRVLGMISSADLLRAAAEEHDAGRRSSGYVDELLEVSSGGGWFWGGEEEERLSGQVVSDVMSTDVVSVEVDAPVPEIARKLRESRIHRVLVVERGRLCGIISTFDLIGLLEKADAV